MEYDPDFLGLLADPKHKVDGKAGGPIITGIAITSDPGEDDTYGISDEIVVTVTFHMDIDISLSTSSEGSASTQGTSETTQVPDLKVEIGDSVIPFLLETDEGPTLKFTYSVRIGDEDPDGIAIGANALSANDAVITGVNGRSAVLCHNADAPDVGHMVLGRLSVPENSPPDTPIGSPGGLSDPYSISGDDAVHFSVDTETGLISTQDPLDYETQPTYSLQWTGNEIPRDVTIYVSNEDEDGAITLNADSHEEGDTLEATLSDPDGGVSDISWRWQVSWHGNPWFDIPWGNDSSFTVDDDTAVGCLRAKAVYTDNFGSGRVAYSDYSRDEVLPYITDVSITSSPSADSTYTEGEVIEVLVEFSEGVEVAGTPKLSLTISEQTGAASFDRVGKPSDAPSIPLSVYFTYTVKEGDVDDNGLSIAAEPFNLGGGSITDFGGNVATLNIDPLEDQSGHKVSAPAVGGL